jgi:hypothetical protein
LIKQHDIALVTFGIGSAVASAAIPVLEHRVQEKKKEVSTNWFWEGTNEASGSDSTDGDGIADCRFGESD